MDTALKGKKQNATYRSQFFSNKNIQKDTFSAVVQNNHENWHKGVLKQLCKNIHTPSHIAMQCNVSKKLPWAVKKYNFVL